MMAASTSSTKAKKQNRRSDELNRPILLSRKFDPSMILLSKDTPRRAYSRRHGDVKRAPKWGQMKLLLGEILWLTKHLDRVKCPEIILVVMGAAPGMHYAALAQMFDEIKEIHLWDSNPFAKDLDVDNPRIKLFRQRMYEQDAVNYANSKLPIFFVSDIRSVGVGMTKENGEKVTERDIEEGVWRDHELQRNVMELIQPESSLLKFRLPYYFPHKNWQPLNKNYLAGQIYVQCFGPPSTTETRLVPRKLDEKTPDGRMQWAKNEYSVQDYEEKLFHVNTAIRDDWNVRTQSGHPVKSLWLNPINNTSGVPDGNELINGFDSAYAMYIIDQYLYYIGDDDPDENSRLVKVMGVWNWMRDSINSKMVNKVSLKFLRERAQMIPDHIWNSDDNDDDSDLTYILNTSEIQQPTPQENFVPTTSLPGLPGESIVRPTQMIEEELEEIEM